MHQKFFSPQLNQIKRILLITATLQIFFQFRCRHNLDIKSPASCPVQLGKDKSDALALSSVIYLGPKLQLYYSSNNSKTFSDVFSWHLIPCFYELCSNIFKGFTFSVTHKPLTLNVTFILKFLCLLQHSRYGSL